MATAQLDTPQFDLSTAVPETDDGKAISALPAFDLKSAVPEDSIGQAQPQQNLSEEQAAPLRQQAFDKMKAGIEQIPDSPASVAVRDFIKNVGKGGIEQYKEAEFASENAQNIPTKQEGESDQDFEKRINAFEQPLEQKEIAKGVMGQLQDTFNMAIAVAAPEMSPKAWATLGTFMVADQTRQAVQRIVDPNMTPSEKDVLDLVSFPIEGGMSHEAVTGISDMISKALTIKGISPTFDVSPDFLKLFAEPQVTERPAPFVKTSQIGWPAPDIETPTGTMSGGVLEKLGITENHANVSINTDMPVRIPLVNLFNLTSDEAKQIGTFEGEGGAIQQDIPQGEQNANSGGESTNKGSEQAQGLVGQEKEGADIRGNAEAGLEAKAGEEVEGEKGTSKIAQSIEQKAKDAGMPEGFEKLSEFDKTTFKEQREKADKIINDNIDDARAMIRGEKPLPEGVRGISLIDAMERHLKTNPDPDMIEELGSSKLVSETSTHAQETALAWMREPDSFTAKMNEINRAKVEAAGGQEKAGKEAQKRLSVYKKETFKVNLSKDELNWEKFLDKEVAC